MVDPVLTSFLGTIALILMFALGYVVIVSVIEQVTYLISRAWHKGRAENRQQIDINLKS